MEAGLVVAALLAPLCLGVIKWGGVLHDAQRVEMTAIPQMDADGKKFWKAGQTCASLADRLRDSFAASLMRTNADLFGSKSTLLNMMTTQVQSIPGTPAVYVTMGWDASALKNWADSVGNPGLASTMRSSAARIEEAWSGATTGSCKVG